VIDAPAALLSYLNATSPLRTLLGGAFVYTPEVPGGPNGPTMPRKAIAFRGTGGFTYPMLRAQDGRVSFRCYGSTHVEAMSVYRALYDRLHDTQNFIVGGVGFHGANEDVPGQPLEDPRTGWPFVHTVYTVKVATVPIPSA